MERKIAELAGHFLNEVSALRHELHKMPETAGKEFKTSALLRERLNALPLKVEKPYLETDVVALLNADFPGRNVTLRADIDALPVAEETTLPYRSEHPGTMHACGHDGHMAMLYGAARILCELRSELPGSVRFLFQPGEEIAAMAKALLEAGAADHPEMDFCAALHGWPNVPHGCISTRCGAVMAAAGFFRLTVLGQGGHGSMPRKAKNPINVIARIADALRRECPESNSNIIPATAEIEGTTRFLYEETGKRIDALLRNTAGRICAEEQASYELVYRVPYPVTASSEEGALLAREVAEQYLGKESFVPMKESAMASEDFSYFLQRSSGVFCHLGLGEHAPLHSSRFDFDDTVLKNGMIFLAAAAYEYLAKHPNQ